MILPAVALGCANEHELEHVRLHLAECIICEEQLVQFQQTATTLAQFGAPAQLQPQPQPQPQPQQLAATHHGLFTYLSTGRLGPMVAAIACVGLIAFSVLYMQQPAQQQSLDLQTRIAPGAPASMQGVDVRIAPGRMLHVEDLPDASAGRTWQLWAINSQGKAQRLALAVHDTHVRLPPSAVTVSVTEESAPGAPQPTGTAVLTASVRLI